jgi:hypothetical protein
MADNPPTSLNAFFKEVYGETFRRMLMTPEEIEREDRYNKWSQEIKELLDD